MQIIELIVFSIEIRAYVYLLLCITFWLIFIALCILIIYIWIIVHTCEPKRKFECTCNKLMIRKVASATQRFEIQNLFQKSSFHLFLFLKLLSTKWSWFDLVCFFWLTDYRTKQAANKNWPNIVIWNFLFFFVFFSDIVQQIFFTFRSFSKSRIVFCFIIIFTFCIGILILISCNFIKSNFLIISKNQLYLESDIFLV